MYEGADPLSVPCLIRSEIVKKPKAHLRQERVEEGIVVGLIRD